MSNDRIYYSHDAEMQANRQRILLTLLCVAFGLGMGTVVALLFAPATGKNTRKDLAKNVEEGVKDGRETVEPMIKRLEEELQDFRKHVEQRLKR